MLRNVSPILCAANLVGILNPMGHGEEIVITDSEFSAQRDAAYPPAAPLISLAGYKVLAIVEAILEEVPLDSVDGPSAFYITEKDGENYQDREVSRRFADLVKVWCKADGLDPNTVLEPLPRKKFHGRARQAQLVIATTERVHHGCFMLRRGALPELT